MKQNSPKFLVIGLVIVILLNILILGWLLADVFSGPNEPKEPTTEEATTEEATTEEPTTQELTTEEPTTEEPTTEEPTTEEPTTEEPTTEEVTTEEPTTEEMPTREPTPYDEVLEEYFTQWAKLYMDEEDTGFDTKRWEFIQEWKAALGGVTFQSVEAICKSVEVLDETEDEVRLLVGVNEICPYITTSGKVRTMRGWENFILRLAKQDGEYRISSVSYCDWMRNFEMGLEEDLKLLRRPTGGVAG